MHNMDIFLIQITDNYLLSMNKPLFWKQNIYEVLQLKQLLYCKKVFNHHFIPNIHCFSDICKVVNAEKPLKQHFWLSNQGTPNPKTHFHLFIETDPIKTAKKSNSWGCFTACLVAVVRAKLISEHLIFLFLIYFSLFSRHVWAGYDSFHLM